MRFLTLRNLVGLTAGITAAAGVLWLTVEQPTGLDFSPFLYVAAVAVVVTAAAGAWHAIASLRAVVVVNETKGYITETTCRQPLSDAYSTREGGQ